MNIFKKHEIHLINVYVQVIKKRMKMIHSFWIINSQYDDVLDKKFPIIYQTYILLLSQF